MQIRRGLPRTLLLALLLRPGHIVSSDLLMEVLWGDEQPRNPANALQVQVSYLRKVFANAEPTGAQVLETRPGGYALVAESAQVDVAGFDAAARTFGAVEADAGVGPLTSALADVDAALGLWRGDAFEEIADLDIARGEAARLNEARWAATEYRNDLRLRLGHHRELVGDLASLVGAMPLREHFREQLVVALYRSGRQSEALRALDDARRTLADELGVDPGTGLSDLEQRVLQHDPTLDWTPPERAPAPAAAPTPDRKPSPPPRGPSTGRLPLALSPLIGRASELARLAELVAGHRLVTLTGPAGAGKSRLAVDVADAQTRPVTYVDFSPIDDQSLVFPTVANALGVTLAPGDDAGRAVADALTNETALLVLDTCEHVVAAAAQLVATILQSAPGVSVVATSRRALTVKGEIAWPVPPLALPPPEAVTADEITAHAAIALFVERATALRPDLAIDDAAAADIAAICTALDGLPLAIELAAARADVLSPAAIRARLADRFDLLVDTGNVGTRQQTLRAAIDWSFDLLTADQARFFVRLAAFAGTFDLDAALAVAGAGLDAPLELLSTLVRQSMVARAGDDRYRLLDTLRTYAAHTLGDLDADDTRRRHALHYVVVAERGEAEIRGPGQLEWLDRFRHDINNFRAAIEWSLTTGDVDHAGRLAGALAWFWTLNGMLSEAVGHLEALIDADDVPDPARARCLWGYALLAASLGRLETAQDAAHRAVKLAEALDDPVATAYGLNALAVAEWALGKHERALDAHATAITLLDKVDDAWGLAICTVLRARTLFDLADPEAARVARDGVDFARRAGDDHVLGIALTQIAHIAAVEGDHARAITAATEALEHQERIGYTEGTVAALHVLGGAHRAGGQLDDARQAHRRALALAARIGHAAAMCEAVEDLARLDAATDPALARTLLAAARSERVSRRLPTRPRDAEILDHLETDLGSITSPSPQPFAALVARLTP